MSENIIKSIDPIASVGSVNDDPPKQATQQVQEKIAGPFCRYPLVKKPTRPTFPPIGEKIVAPVGRHPLVKKKPTSKPTANRIADIETELADVKKAWAKYRSTNGRDAVYIYLEAVFAVVRRWQRLNSALKNSRAALRLQHDAPKMKPEPFGVVIFCTADPEVADSKTRSKWSRVLRFSRKAKPSNQRLAEFIKSNGGINACARMFARKGK